MKNSTADEKMLRYEARLRAKRDGVSEEAALQTILSERARREAASAQLRSIRFPKRKGSKRLGKDHAPQHVYGVVGPILRAGAPGSGKRK